ncbi:MAG: outer membrane beta-barrel protein, partial [Bacteroidota bacterium]
MKKTLILSGLLFATTFAFSQIKFGARLGVSTTDLEAGQLLITNQETLEEFNLAVQDAKFGVHAGLFAKIPITDLFFIQPEILLNSNRVDFQLGADSLGSVVSEKYQYLDIPLIFGMQLGPIKPQAGLIGHVFLRSNSDLDIEGYKQDFQNLTIGFQAGLGIEIKKILFDVRYEGNLSKFGSHITVAGQEYNFDDRPSRLVFT